MFWDNSWRCPGATCIAPDVATWEKAMQRAKDAIRGLYPAGPLEAADPHDSSAWRWHVPTTGTRYFIPTDDPKERHEERPAAADRRSWRRPEAHALSSFNLSSAHQHRAEKLGAVSERIDL